MKLFALFVCAAALLVAGCSSNCCHKAASCSKAAVCAKGHQCCVAANTDCAHCPKCSAH